MRVALAQINPTVGDIAGNVRKIGTFLEAARDQRADLCVFPELSIIGYPPKDLLLKPRFIEDNLRGLDQLAKGVSGIEAIVGYAQPNESSVGRPLHNAVALLRDGRVHSRHYKTLLPTYDVFDESRYFEPGKKPAELASVAGWQVGLSICEDLWNDERLDQRRLYHVNPIADIDAAGAQIVINASASPFVVGKHAFRLEVFGTQARRFGKPVIYVNQVGGNDELVFDGNSVVLDATGKTIAQAKDFQEDLLIADFGPSAARGAINVPSGGIESIYKALVLGLRDYVRKCGFSSVVVGLSGGVDSALVAALAAAAMGPDKVVGVAMPSRYSSEHSLTDAAAVAKNLGIQFHVLSISKVHEAYETTLAAPFAGTKPDVTEENIQARIRGTLLMAFSNKFGHLLLTTGNKSELAVGYCTLYGDMCGGLAVISDLPKTTVWEMARWINEIAGRELIPAASIAKAPSAELRPNQTDQDSLPPYDVLDSILYRNIELEMDADKIIADGYDAATVRRVIRLVDLSEYKRRQAAPGLKVTSRAFGFGRRMPIAQRYNA